MGYVIITTKKKREKFKKKEYCDISTRLKDLPIAWSATNSPGHCTDGAIYSDLPGS